MANFFERTWDKVQDVFDGDEDEKKKKAPSGQRPEGVKGWGLERVNPNYSAPKDEFGKNLWLSGGDNASPFNSWDTRFVDRMLKQQDQITKDKGDLSKQFDRDDATGVVTWDHVTDSGKELKFGDVFDQGKYLGNVYDVDEGTGQADLMMSAFTLSKEAQAAVGKDRNPAERLRAEVQRAHDDNNNNAAKMQGLKEHQAKVDKVQDKISGWAGDAGDEIAAGVVGAAGGVAAGWSAAKAVKAPQAKAAMFLGATVFGAGSAILNRDDVTEQMANAYEVSRRAYEEDDPIGASMTSIKQGAGVLGRSLAPFSNLSRGIADATDGTVGDGISTFSTDRPAWALPVDIAASVADSVVSFGLAVPRAMYLTQMGASTVGGVGELTVGQGTRWDASSGTFKNAYVDEEEGFTPGRAAAAWGAVGIDAVQFGMAKGVADQVARYGAMRETARIQAGKNVKDGSWGKAVSNQAGKFADDTLLTARDKKFLGDKAADVVKAETIGGKRFFLDAQGRSIASRNTMAAFVPSEFVQTAAAARNARTSARVVDAGPRNYADEYANELYKASKSLNSGENPMRSALVNAFGEGLEEAVQEVLEQASFGHRASLEDVATSYAYGTAAGFGMGVARNVTAPGTMARIKPLVGDAWQAVYDKEMTEDDWKSLTKAERLQLAQDGANIASSELVKEMAGITGDELGGTTQGGIATSQYVADQAALVAESQNKKAGQSTHQMDRAIAQPITRVEDRTEGGYVDYNKNPYATAGDTTLSDIGAIVNYFKGRELSRQQALENMAARTQELETAIAEATDQQDLTAATAKLKELQEMVPLYTEMKGALDFLIQRAERMQQLINGEHAKLATVGDNEQLRIQILNHLRNETAKFNREMENFARMGDTRLKVPLQAQQMAAWAVINRSPDDNVGSYQFAIPGLSWFTVVKNTTGGILPSQAYGTQMTFDFDGDRLMLDPTLIVSYNTFRSMASGSYAMFNKQVKEKDANGKTVWYDVPTFAMSATDVEKANVRDIGLVSAHPKTSAEFGYYKKFIDGLTNMLMKRYALTGGSAFDTELFRQALWAEVDQAFRALPLDADTTQALLTVDKDRVGARPITKGDDFMEAFLHMMLTSPLVSREFQAKANDKEKLRNEPAEIHSILRAHVSEFASQYQKYQLAQIKEKNPHTPNVTQGAGPVQRADEIRSEAALPSFNMFTTVIDLLGSDSLRAMQALHQSPINTTDSEATKVPTDAQLRRAEEHLRAMAQSTHDYANETGISEFDVAARVLDMATQVVRTAGVSKAEEGAAIFALLHAQMYDPATSRLTTTAQLFAMEIIKKIKTEASDILRRDEVLADKIRFLEAAARATRDPSKPSKRSWGETTFLRETLSGLTIAEIVPSDQLGNEMAEILQAGGTVEQAVRNLLHLDEKERSEVGRFLKSHALYKEAKSDYKDLIDYLLEAANLEIKTNLTGDKAHYSGVLAERDKNTSKQLRELLTALHTAYRSFTQGVPATDRAAQREQVSQLIDHLPQDGKRLLNVLGAGFDLLPFTPIEGQPGRYYIPDWMLDAVLEPDVKLAEMKIWLARTKLQLKKIEFQQSRKKESLDDNELFVSDTLTQVLLSLRNDLVKFAEIFTAMEKAQSVEDFTHVLLTQLKGVRKPPILMYENHVDLFEPSKREGGWNSTPATFGSSVRKAMLVEMNAAGVYDEMLENELATDDALDLLNSVSVEERGTNPMWLAAARAFEDMSNRPKILSPSTIFDTMLGTMLVTIKSHTKGETAEEKVALGNAAVMEAAQAGYIDVFQDALSLTLSAVDWDDARNDLSHLVKTRTIADSYGQTIDVSALLDANGDITLESLIAAMTADRRLRPLLAEMLLPKGYDYNERTQKSTLALTGPTNLKELITGNYHSAAFEKVNGRFTLRGAVEYGALLSAKAQAADSDQVFALEQQVLARVWVRVANGEGRTTDNQLRQIIQEEYINEVEAQSAIGTLRARSGVQAEPLIKEAVELEQQALRKRYKGKEEKVNSKAQGTAARGELKARERVAEWAKLGAEIALQKIFDKKFEGRDRSNTAEYEKVLGNAIPSLAQGQAEAEAVAKGDLLAIYASQFYISPGMSSPGDIRTKRLAILGYLKTYRGELLRRGGPAGVRKLVEDVGDLLDSENEITPDSLTIEEWSLASRIVISHALELEAPGMVDTTVPLRLVPELDETGGPGGISNWAWFDPTFAARLEVYKDPTSPLSTAATKLAEEMGASGLPPTKEEIAKHIRRLYGSETTPTWTPSMAAYAIASTDTLPSSSAAGGAQLAGNSPKTMHAIATATITTYDEPPAEYLRPVTIQRVSANEFVAIDELTGKTLRMTQISGSFGVLMAADGSDQIASFEGMHVEGAEHYRAFTPAHLKRELGIGQTRTIKIFSPMHRPTGEKWRNNVYFDGATVFDGVQKVSALPSLPAEIFERPFGIHQQQVRAVLDAVKKKMAAAFRLGLEKKKLPSLDDPAKVAEYFEKLAVEISTEMLGLVRVGQSHHKATLKFIMAAHVVTYSDGTVSSVTDYLAAMEKDAKTVLAQKPQLHTLTHRQQDTLYLGVGHAGTLLTAGQVELNTAGAMPFSFDNLNEAQRRLVKNLRNKISLAESAAVLRTPLRKMSRNLETAEESLKFSSEQLIVFREHRAEGNTRRSDLTESVRDRLRAAQSDIKTREKNYAKQDFNAANSLMKKGINTVQNLGSAKATEPATAVGSGPQSLAFEVSYGDNATGAWQDGHVTDANFNDFTTKLDAVQGDYLVINLTEFSEAPSISFLERVLEHAATRGVEVKLYGYNAAADAAAKAVFARNHYMRRKHPSNMWHPNANQTELYAQEVAASRAMEQGPVQMGGRMACLVVAAGSPGFEQVQDSTGIMIQDKARTTNQSVVRNETHLASVSTLEGSQEAAAIEMVKQLANANSDWSKQLRKALKARGTSDSTGHYLSSNEMIEDLINRANTGHLNIVEGTTDLKLGMIIVKRVRPKALSDPPTYYFEVHGTKALTEADVLKARDAGQQIIFSSAEPDTNQTSFDGKVMKIHRATSDGKRRYSLRVTIEEIVKKFVAGWGGLKTLTTALPEQLEFLKQPLFSDPNNDTSFEMVIAYDDVDSKKAELAIGFQKMGTYLGFDLTKDLYYAAYREDFDPGNTEHVRKWNTLREELDNFAAANNSGTVKRVGEKIDRLGSKVKLKTSAPQGLIVGNLLASVNRQLEKVEDSIIQGKLDKFSRSQRIYHATLHYLTLQNAHLSDILSSAGVSDPRVFDIDNASHMVPEVFAKLFDGDAMLEGTIADFNNRFARTEKSGVQLLNDYSVLIFNPNGNDVRGFISFDVRAVSGEHNGREYMPDADRAMSPHDSRWRDLTYGGWLAAKRDTDFFVEYQQSLQKVDLTSFSARGVLTMDMDEIQYLPWMQRSSADILYRIKASEAITPFFQHIELTPGPGQTAEGDVAAARARIKNLASKLMLNRDGADEKHIHTLIRLLWYKPGRREGEPETAGQMTLDEVNLALDAMEDALRNGYSPLYRGVIDQMPIEIADAIAKKQIKDREAGRVYYRFQFWPSPDAKVTEPTSVNDFRQMFTQHAWLDNTVLRDPVIITAMDGLLHQYQSRAADALLQPVSMDVLRDLQILSDTSRMDAEILKALESGQMSVGEFLGMYPAAFNASAFRNHQNLLESAAQQARPEVFSLAQAMYTNDDTNLWAAGDPAEEILTAVRKNLQQWHKASGMGYPTQRAIAATRFAGQDKSDASPKQHAMVRGLFAFSASLRLANPALPVSALIETAWRANVADLRRMGTGQSTKGFGMQLLKTVEKGKLAGNLMLGIGYVPYFTADQAQRVENVIAKSGTLSSLRKILHDDVDGYFEELSLQGLWRPLRGFNTLAVAIQDLARGTKSKRLTRTYISAVLSVLYEMGVPMETAIDAIDTDPGWVKANYPRAHKVGVAHVNDMRGVQQTAANHILTSTWRPGAESGNAGLNAFTTLAAGIPLMFSRYTLNFTISALGMRGFDSMVALMLDGQKKPKMLQAWSSSIKGDPSNERFDFSEVTEGIDAMDLFVNMGITHTQLFTLGLLLQGLGLSGEDEETRRRRRLANMQGAGFVYDPRNMENDFRNANSLFLDFLPDALEQPFAIVDHNGERRSPVTMHWTVKQFMSPIIGMERYFETGDFRQVLWGFQDAIGSMPLFNATTLDRAMLTGDELARAAQDATAQGGPNALPNTYGFVSGIVHYYQYALMESSFLNSIYMGMDEYDRDPYVLPMRDSDGDLQRDIEGNTREMGDAHMGSEGLDGRGKGLQKYVDDEGNVQQGYVSQSNSTTQMRVLAENRLSYALITSLFTGLSGQGSNLRYAMPVKTREFDKPELSKDQQKAAVLGALRNDEGFMGLIAKGNSKDAKLEDQAVSAIALSFLDTEGNEVLTKDGAMAVFRGIVGGTALPDSEALAGVYVDAELRKELQQEWLQELAEEGVKLGLSPAAATQRAKNIWYGPYDSSAPGIADILWNKNLIPFDKTQQYQQLNTTYITGPDGKPWATGFTRGKLLGALGLAPIQRMYNAGDMGIDTDSRGNVADAIVGINTGSRALKRVDDSWDIPTDVEIGDAITEAIENIDLSGFGGSGYRRRGGGGGGGYAQRPNIPYDNPFRFNDLGIRVQSIRPPYANDIRPVLTDNVSIRREETHRQRFSSERGRLKPWQ